MVGEIGPEQNIPQPGMLEPGKGGQEIPKELRELFERSGGLPIEGADMIEDLQSAEVQEGGDVSELTQAVEDILAFTEGLPEKEGQVCNIDPKNAHDLGNRRKIGYWKNLFTTVESSTKRPKTASYVQIALEESTDKKIREAEKWRRNPQKFDEKRRRYYEAINRQRIQVNEESLSSEAINLLIASESTQRLNEYSAVGNLLGLRNYIDAREAIDYAFIQRMSTCENPENAAELGGKIRAVTPDGGHWQAYFQTEGLGTNFGEKVDEVFLEMVKYGLSDKRIRQIGLTPIPVDTRNAADNRVYANGFNNTTEFATWYQYHMRKADGRADALWNAWKLMLTWEVVEKQGIYIKDSDKKYVFTAPPIGNSLLSYTMHLREKRTHEYGLDSEGKRYSKEKFLSHSGLPISIDVIPNLCEDFLHQTKIKFDRSYLRLVTTLPDGGVEEAELSRKIKEVFSRMFREGVLPSEGDEDFIPLRNKKDPSLRQQIYDWLKGEPKKDDRGRIITGRDGNPELKQPDIEVSLWDLRVYGGWSFADKTFPWLLSDQPGKDSEAGELPMGAFSFWLLTRNRASKILDDVKARPDLRDLGNPDFFASKLRNWVKVLGSINDDLPPDKNPRAVLLASYIYYRFPGTGEKNAPIIKNNKELVYRTKSQSEGLAEGKAGRVDRGVLIGDVLHHAEMCGWLRTEISNSKWSSDADWIKEVCDLRLGM